jgi:hypothetical protein
MVLVNRFERLIIFASNQVRSLSISGFRVQRETSEPSILALLTYAFRGDARSTNAQVSAVNPARRSP